MLGNMLTDILATVFLVIVLVYVPLHLINSLWLKPKRLEKCLRDQGFRGNPYRPIYGDLAEITGMARSSLSKSFTSLTHDIVSRILPFLHHTIQQYGKESFIWYGRNPKINITKIELIKEIFTKYEVFTKQSPAKKTMFGLPMREGEDWAKVRKIINPAFEIEKLKNMLPTMEKCCDKMIRKWDEVVATSGSAEVDVYSSLSMYSGDVIAITSFGSSYEEGEKLYKLQEEDLSLTFQAMRTMTNYIPGWRYLPTKANRRKKKLDREIKETAKTLVDKRKKLKQIKDSKNKDDLLSVMLESNEKEIEEDGVGLPMEDLIEECKLFMLAGKDTTSSLLTWVMVLLSQHQDWQNKAREEVLSHFGKDYTPDYKGLNSLKIMNMIINETLRIYPPIATLSRIIHTNTNLKQLTLLSGMEISMPLSMVHRDRELWGDDASEFNPNRFSEGVLSASKVPGSFFPFGGGPRICVGKNYALIESKLALTKILQRFSFELSSSYVHAPIFELALVPQFGAQLILHKI
ncbi:cytochrome P450 CYP72A219-like [Chenopodium quinoa]|uniref:cytochrome P450 CYP72A219-like n=1 Tax=Chenopodium quinoa TaxID=63459 RepID=UPI000B77D1F8|nr:cytochrome P450 CYP72A219-like [Chenopodium quinoa]